MNENSDFHAGFSKLNRKKRIELLVAAGLITAKDASLLTSKKMLPFALAEKFIENTIGYFSLPLGIAVNFKIDHKDYVIPMVVEETSIIAAASKTAKWVRDAGEIQTENLGHLSIGQIQLAKVENFAALEKNINAHKQALIEDVNQGIAQVMFKRGGGMKEILIRRIPRDDGHDMAVVHVLVETCDAMGANIINQICEYLRGPIEKLTRESVSICILSNLTDTKLTRAKIILHDIDPKLGHAIEEAALFAHNDPYRAATHNKGVLNGMDSIAIATGNDWRAIEAGVHAYAARSGKYAAITRWRMQGKELIGELEAPINVGIVGGVTSLHPTAKLCLKIINVKSSGELARIIAAVGLTQNLGALRALTSEGIVKGHMKLHLNNVCLATGATPQEMPSLKRQLEQYLDQHSHVTTSVATALLTKLRRKKRSSKSKKK